jgi:cytoskeletal protein CcmA (bactofilin family)
MVKKLWKGLAVLPILLLLIVVTVAPAAAADLRSSDDTIIIASGEVIDDDLYLGANRVVVNGTVNGDVLCAGTEVTVDGLINGNLMALGNDIDISGQVTHSVRVAGSNIDVSGSIGGDLVVAGSTVNLSEATGIGRDLIFAVDKIDVETLIPGDILGYGSRVGLHNGVFGDVKVGVEQLTITDTADIRGNLIYTSDNEADIYPGAQIGGNISHEFPEVKEPAIPDLGFGWKVFGFVMALVLGIIVIAIIPGPSRKIAATLKRKPLLSLGWGAIILFATPLAALIVFITIIGIPVGIIGLITYGILIYLSQIAVGLFLGYWILGSFTQVESRGSLIGALAIGLAILTLLKLIPFIGFALWLATTLFGIGAIILSFRKEKVETPAGSLPEVTGE